MKKLILSIVTLFLANISQSQSIIDSVSIGAGYMNQKWYSLQNDEQGAALKDNWDIAFDCSGFGSSIHINSVTGTKLWAYPNSDISGWAALDTMGITSWVPQYNSDDSWSVGAFDRGMVLSNPFDLGWGIYNSMTHIVTGDSLFVIQLANGSYKKLWVETLAGGIYTFKYADINGANLQTATLSKAAYINKNFGYYSLQNNAALDREPVSADWDLLFTQYTTFIPTAYTVSGVLHNAGVEVAQADQIGNVGNYTNYGAHVFSPSINEIGYDWKSFNGMGYTIADSLIYFVKTVNNDIWKVIPLGFGGSATGNFIFSKEKLATTGLNTESGGETSVLSIYPNPSNGNNVTVIYSFKSQASPTLLNVYDLMGKSVYSEALGIENGLQAKNLVTSQLKKGVYLVTLENAGKKIQQRMIIQ